MRVAQREVVQQAVFIIGSGEVLSYVTLIGKHEHAESVLFVVYHLKNTSVNRQVAFFIICGKTCTSTAILVDPLINNAACASEALNFKFVDYRLLDFALFLINTLH